MKKIDYTGSHPDGVSVSHKGITHFIPSVSMVDHEPASVPDDLADWLVKNRKDEFKLSTRKAVPKITEIKADPAPKEGE